MFKGISYVYQSVPDIAKSCQFFEKELGFKLHTDQPDVKGLAAGSGYLILHKDDPSFLAKERGAGAHVCIEVDDIAAYHAELTKRGVKVSELTQRPWGQRDFFLNDPDGYSWCFAQTMR